MDFVFLDDVCLLECNVELGEGAVEGAQLVERGASVKVIQARLGHKSAVETLDTYGHLWPDDEDLTRQAVDAVLAPMSEKDRPEDFSTQSP